jgi:hypothetical protein
MSYDIFKQNMLSYMRNQSSIGSKEDFAKKLVQEYDALVKRGRDVVNGITVLEGNTESMEAVLNGILTTAFQQSSGEHAILTNLGPAFQAYWSGAKMNLIPPPKPTITPAGVMVHITQVSNMVTNPGTWGNVDSTVLIPPEKANELADRLLEVKDEPMTNDDIASARQEIDEAETNIIYNPNVPDLEKQTAIDYVNLKKKEINSGVKNAPSVPLTADEIAAVEALTPDEIKCPSGIRVVAAAKRDIGIIEAGTPPGKNYGGFPGGVIKAAPGRIDKMVSDAGLNNQAKVKSSGEGWYWCASAVTAWWKEAGLKTPPGAAGCDNWVSWAKKNGYWSKTPKIGAAVLYGSASDAHHIGIVSGVVKGRVITIEGNTSGGGFNRNGCGVFQKTPKKYLGFVLPPDCAK